MDVSIVIVSWNTCDILRDCLMSVYKETNDLSFEVIVIDNASNDGSCEMVKESFPEAILIENKENVGFAAANNQGMELTKSGYVLLLNSDTIVLDNAVGKMMNFAEKNERVAVTGCRILNKDMTLQPSCFMFPSLLNMLLSSTYLYKLFPRNRFFGRERMTWWKRDDVRQVEVVTGCFMLVRQQAIDEIGLMDDSYFVYAEEADWCYRFYNAGWENVFSPEASIIHLGGQSSKQVRVKMLIQLRISILRFFENHYNLLGYFTACLLTVFFFAVRIPVLAVVGALVPDKRENAFKKIRAYARGIGKVSRQLFATSSGERR
jgi:hypothetical protein